MGQAIDYPNNLHRKTEEEVSMGLWKAPAFQHMVESHIFA
jgi:hypothetical protein